MEVTRNKEVAIPLWLQPQKNSTINPLKENRAIIKKIGSKDVDVMWGCLRLKEALQWGQKAPKINTP